MRCIYSFVFNLNILVNKKTIRYNVLAFQNDIAKYQMSRTLNKLVTINIMYRNRN